MKKIYTLLTALSTVCVFAQAPIIEGTYFPVRNTGIRQVWDMTPGSIAVPQVGPNQVWDYRKTNGQFGNVIDTFPSKFLDPTVTPYDQYFPQGNMSTFIRTPLNNFSDSLFYYYKVTQQGTYVVGGFNIAHDFDSTIINTKEEFFMPFFFNYGDVYNDTSFYTAYAKKYQIGASKYSVKILGKKIKRLEYIGYGTLKLPNGTFSNVALIKENYTASDDIYVDLALNGNYTFATNNPRGGTNYYFFRNNTFGSAYLAYFSGNTANTQMDYGWYTLPIDFGSISGSVFTNSLETTPVTQGDVFLYRENSNFAKNDILATSKLSAAGAYNFDSIPYGEYRIAVRPKTSFYPNASITYYGDTTNWIHAGTITTTASASFGHKIHLQYHKAPAGTATISGQLSQDLFYSRGASVMQSNPISGIGIVIKRNPGASTARNAVTDANGEFNVSGLDNGSYTAFVDIPGMHMTGTYSFSINNNVVIQGLDYTAGKDSIHPVSSVIGIKEITTTSKGSMMKAFPNPYSTSTTIQLELTSSADVLLEVYNMLGQKIATLDKSQKQAGNYTYNFDAKSLNYSPGMYFVKLKAGNKNDVLKLIEQ